MDTARRARTALKPRGLWRDIQGRSFCSAERLVLRSWRACRICSQDACDEHPNPGTVQALPSTRRRRCAGPGALLRPQRRQGATRSACGDTHRIWGGVSGVPEKARADKDSLAIWCMRLSNATIPPKKTNSGMMHHREQIRFELSPMVPEHSSGKHRKDVNVFPKVGFGDDGVWTSNVLGQKYFEKSSVPQNSSHWKTYCKACVQHHVNCLKEERQAGTNIWARRGKFSPKASSVGLSELFKPAIKALWNITDSAGFILDHHCAIGCAAALSWLGDRQKCLVPVYSGPPSLRSLSGQHLWRLKYYLRLPGASGRSRRRLRTPPIFGPAAARYSSGHCSHTAPLLAHLAAPRAAKDTAVQWAQSETGSPKRVHGAAQVDAGQNRMAWPAPHSDEAGWSGCRWWWPRNGRGSAQEEAAVAESTRGGTGAGRGYSIEGGTGRAWLGGGERVVGGVEVAPW
ncbi:hypothetical protein B0H14DRAFT_2606720 [Mycena olivaceomarginata]|nr:hypothetical protein B0H14DRAFT_2606720 [Mycena olivaceomarginata]